MPFIPDPNAKGINKNELKKLQLQRAKDQERATKFASEVAKKEATLPKTITRLTGMDKTADTLGSLLGRRRSNEEQKQFIPEPTGREKAGAAFNIGSLAFPVKAASTLATRGLSSALPKISPKIANVVGNAVGFGTGGQAVQAGKNLEENKSGFTPGGITAISTAIPLAGPLASSAKKGIGRLAGETFGATTGTGYGSIKAAYESAKQGGKKSEAFTAALRGKISPEQIVEEARGSLGQIIGERTKKYEDGLTKIKGMTQEIDVTPIREEIAKGLQKFGVEVGENGLDFSRSPIRFSRKAQEEINTIIEEMKSFGTKEGDNTPLGLDRLKRAFNDLYSDSSEARSFVTGVSKATRKLLSEVPGYDKMSKEYGDSTEVIKEIQKGLSLGTKASTDTAFRKLTTALRTNNEFRKQLVDELDKVSGGSLSSGIAGQQLSEKLPRGLMRTLGGGGAIIAGASGIGVLALLKAGALTSPRLVGEVVNAMGVSSKGASKFLKSIGIENISKTRTPGDIFLDSTMGKKVKESIKGMRGKGGLSTKPITQTEYKELSKHYQSVLSNINRMRDRGMKEGNASIKNGLKVLRDLEAQMSKVKP